MIVFNIKFIFNFIIKIYQIKANYNLLHQVSLSHWSLQYNGCLFWWSSKLCCKDLYLNFFQCFYSKASVLRDSRYTGKISFLYSVLQVRVSQGVSYDATAPDIGRKGTLYTYLVKKVDEPKWKMTPVGHCKIEVRYFTIMLILRQFV